jgi:hypothetical protein
VCTCWRSLRSATYRQPGVRSRCRGLLCNRATRRGSMTPGRCNCRFAARRSTSSPSALCVTSFDAHPNPSAGSSGKAFSLTRGTAANLQRPPGRGQQPVPAAGPGPVGLAVNGRRTRRICLPRRHRALQHYVRRWTPCRLHRLGLHGARTATEGSRVRRVTLGLSHACPTPGRSRTGLDGAAPWSSVAARRLR